MNSKKGFILPVLILVLTAVACKKDSGDPGPSGFLDLHEISNTHSFNESPCPQKLGTASVSCSNLPEASGCTADSAFVVNDHPYLWNAFTGDVYSIALSEAADVRLNIWFNCRAAENINHAVEVRFYRHGELVETEYVAVHLTYEK